MNFSWVKATAWCCGTGATMNILNYFYNTNFGITDTDNIKKLIRFGKFQTNHEPSEFEIALFLLANNFHIKYFSEAPIWNFEFLAKNPKWHQKKYWYEYFPRMDKDSHLDAISKLYSHENFEIFEGENQDFEKIIKNFSCKNNAFIFMPDYFLIHNFPNPENWNGGHIMMSTGFDKKSDKIVLFESTPNTPDAFFQNNPDKIERTFEEFSNSTFYMHFFVISK